VVRVVDELDSGEFECIAATKGLDAIVAGSPPHIPMGQHGEVSNGI